MLQFEWPWIFAVLPLPWLIRRLLPAATTARGAPLRVPALEDFQFLVDPGTAAGWRASIAACALAWILLVTSAARPQWLGDAIEVPVNGRDLMLAVDLSESMRETDFVVNSRPVDRLTATKIVARDFIDRGIEPQGTHVKIVTKRDGIGGEDDETPSRDGERRPRRDAESECDDGERPRSRHSPPVIQRRNTKETPANAIATASPTTIFFHQGPVSCS